MGRVIDIATEVGSREFESPLRRMGLPVRLRALSCGDFAFQGEGPQGVAGIGIERKQVNELVGAASRQRYVGRQLPRMVERYDYCFLLIEGLTRYDGAGGTLQQGRPIRTKRGQDMTIWFDAGWAGPSTYERYLMELLTIRLRAACTILTTTSPSDTCATLHALYRWWQKPWESHRSHLAVEQATPDPALLRERTFRRQTFAQWPGIGWKRSAQVSQYFSSVAAACAATEEEWMEALRVKHGRTIVRKLMAMLHGRGDAPAKGV